MADIDDQEDESFWEKFNPLTGSYRRKTPMSVQMLDSGLDYTPVGVVKGVSDIKNELSKDDPNFLKAAGMTAVELAGVLPMGGPILKGMLRKGDDVAAAVTKNIDETLDTKTAANITDEDLKAWKDNPSNTTSDSRRKQLKGRDDELMALATEYQDSLAANGAEASKGLLVKYRKLVDKINPIRPIKTMPELISNTDVVGALGEKTNILGKKKTGILSVNREFKQGEIVTSRLDINGYTNHDKWVAAVRTTEDVAEGFSPTAYGKAVYLKNVNMLQPEGLQKKSLRIATGKEKGPHAVMEGAYQQQSPEEIYEYAKSVFEDSLKPDSEWVQIGYNPVRAGYFYDRATGLPLEAAEEVIQVGNLVLGRKVTKGDIETYMFNEGGIVMNDKPKYPDAAVVDKDNQEIGFSLGGNLFLNEQGENSLRKGSFDIPEGEKVSTKEGSMFTRFSLGSDLDNFIIDMSDKLGDKIDVDLGSAALRYKIGDNSNIYIENIGSDAPSIGYRFSKRFNEGGLNMSEQEQMENILADNPEQGMAETVDPVSGNDVPPGSLPAEVRDDVPAQLSEGEYVVPADVVRYFGVKAFEDMRMQAKQGMADMDAEGRIGGDPMQEEALPFSDEELITSDVPEDDTMPMMNEGGVVYAQKGIDLSRFVKAPEPGANEVTYKTYVNAEGMEIVIPFLGNDPMGVIPEGYFLKGTVSDVDEESIRSGSGGGGGSDDDDNKPEAIDWSDPAVGTYEKFKETYDQMNSGTGNTLIAGATALGGLPFALGLKGMFKLQSNAMLKGVTSQLAGMQDSDPNYSKLLGMQNLLQGKNEDGSDKPKGGLMDTLFSGETYEGNSFTESFANMFTPGDGASYVKGQLVDDATGARIAPGGMTSTNNKIRGTANSTSNDRPVYNQRTVKEEMDNLQSGYEGAMNKGGLVNRPKKKSKKNK